MQPLQLFLSQRIFFLRVLSKINHEPHKECNALIRAKVFLYLVFAFIFNFTSMFLYAISKKLSCIGTNTEHLLLSFVEQVVFGITLFSKDYSF